MKKYIILLCVVLMSGCMSTSQEDLYKEQVEVERLVRNQMDKYELYSWEFKWMYEQSTVYGKCDSLNKIIYLNRELVWLNPMFTTEEVILHEIAHALDWMRNISSGHGESWELICEELGIEPNVTVDCFNGYQRL